MRHIGGELPHLLERGFKTPAHFIEGFDQPIQLIIDTSLGNLEAEIRARDFSGGAFDRLQSTQRSSG